MDWNVQQPPEQVVKKISDGVSAGFRCLKNIDASALIVFPKELLKAMGDLIGSARKGPRTGSGYDRAPGNLSRNLPGPRHFPKKKQPV